MDSTIKQPTLRRGALLGAATSLSLMGLLYLGHTLAGLPFVPFDLFDWLARALPGDVIALGIGAIVNVIVTFNLGPTDTTAKFIEQLQALLLFIAGGALLGVVVAALVRRSQAPGEKSGFTVGLIVYVAVLLIEAAVGFGGGFSLAAVWLAIVIIGWGGLLGYLLAAQPRPVSEAEQRSRRAMLVKVVGGSAGFALASWSLGRLVAQEARTSGAGQNLAAAAPTATPPTATALPNNTAATRDHVSPAPGTRPELTANEDFYRIDINTRPARLDGETWRLEVVGLFDNPQTLALADIMAYAAVTQPITLACISNRVGGDLIGTSNWTGVRLRDFLQDLGLRPEARALYVEAADGFYETVVMEDMMDPRALLVYGMNGETLTAEHGFPLRIYIPDRYGMKQPKWITRIEATDGAPRGYWVERGWSQEARPQILSMIDTVAEDATQDGLIPVGGIAWAGDRGIQKVEVQVDEGEWVESVLRTPPLSPLTWVQWRYDWPAASGRHSLRVRATDGTGALQIEQEQGVRPDGATGYHSVTVNI